MKSEVNQKSWAHHYVSLVWMARPTDLKSMAIFRSVWSESVE